MKRQTNRWMKKKTDRLIAGQINVHRLVDKEINRHIDGERQTDIQMDGERQTDRQMDGETDNGGWRETNTSKWRE